MLSSFPPLSHVVFYSTRQDLFDRPNFEFVRHDITEPFRAEVDQIYNMACPASPVHYQYNPIKTTKVTNRGLSVCPRPCSVSASVSVRIVHGALVLYIGG